MNQEELAYFQMEGRASDFDNDDISEFTLLTHSRYGYDRNKSETYDNPDTAYWN